MKRTDLKVGEAYAVKPTYKKGFRATLVRAAIEKSGRPWPHSASGYPMTTDSGDTVHVSAREIVCTWAEWEVREAVEREERERTEKRAVAIDVRWANACAVLGFAPPLHGAVTRGITLEQAEAIAARLTGLSEALRDLREAATDSYKSGRLSDPAAFVGAGNAIDLFTRTTPCDP